MFRHTALFLLRETAGAAERTAMLRGLGSLLEACPTVRGGDYGVALALPRLSGARDIALHLDFDDAEGYEAYVAHPAHVEVAAFNASLSVDGETVRVDWRYDGPPRVHPGGVRHCEAFTWAGGADDASLAAARGLASADGVLSALAVEDSGKDARAADWILDVELAHEQAALAFLAGAAYRGFTDAIAAAVEPGRTARITHLEHGRPAITSSPGRR